MTQPRLYVLIGVPGSGKTTWIQKQKWIEDCAYISTDIYVDKFARRLNKTYREVFDLVMPRCVRLMMRAVRLAQEQGRDVIWDQTSTTVASRERKFRALPGYYAIAVVFPTPEKRELARRLKKRKAKEIPESVVKNMIQSLEQEPPHESEGFQEIWHAR
jgi:predicted kinase